MNQDKTVMRDILVINVCSHELHYFEFVKPVVDIIENSGKKYVVIHKNHLSKGMLIMQKG